MCNTFEKQRNAIGETKNEKQTNNKKYEKRKEKKNGKQEKKKDGK